MKILNREEFLNLPEGVIYAKFEPYFFGEIAIKGETTLNDWYYQDFLELEKYDNREWIDVLIENMQKGTSIKMDFDSKSSDGCYNEKQLFAVFEKEDVLSLIERLNKAVSNYPKF